MSNTPSENRITDGPACRGCGLPNYAGLCPHCRGDQDAYEHELVPPFSTSRTDDFEAKFAEYEDSQRIDYDAEEPF